MSIAASNASQSAINAARHKSAVAQQGYQRKATALFNENLPKNSAAAAQSDIAQGQSDRQNAFNALRNITQTTTTPSANTPEAMAATRASTAGDTFTTNSNTAQSKLGGYGDWGTALNVANQDTNSRIGVINDAARANAGLLPLEIESASHAGDALGNWGKIIGALGTVVGGVGGGARGAVASSY